MGVLGSLENKVGQGLKKTGGALNITRKKRLGEKKAATTSEMIFLVLGILLGLAYGLLVKEEGRGPYTNIIFGVTAGAVGGIVFGYLVDMISVLIEGFFSTLMLVIKKTAPPLFFISLLATATFLVVWAYTKEFGPIGSVTFEQMDEWMVKIVDVLKTVFEHTFVKLFNIISDLLGKLWDFLLNH